MTTLEEVKEFATEFIKKELDMLQKVSSLAEADVLRFNEWYETNPYYLKLQELLLITKTKKKE
jgi:hypothetical protein